MENRVNNGGPAFPVGDGVHEAHPGMTRRQWYAGLAMQGLIAGRVKDLQSDVTAYARLAFELADALIAAENQ